MSSDVAASSSAFQGSQRISTDESLFERVVFKRSFCAKNGLAPYFMLPKKPTSVGNVSDEVPVTLRQGSLLVPLAKPHAEVREYQYIRNLSNINIHFQVSVCR